MGRDLHAFLEYYSSNAGIWEGLAKFYFRRYSGLFQKLIERANGMPRFNDTILVAAPVSISLEVWAEWISDRKELGIHHEGHMDYDQLAGLYQDFLLEDTPCPAELAAIYYAGLAVYSQDHIPVRFIYWFDN